MKKILIFVCTVFAAAFTAYGQPLPYLKEPAFQAGEELSYRLRYGMISAATGVLKVEDSNIKFSSPHSYHLSARGQTSSAFSIFFTVDNRYNSYIDSRTDRKSTRLNSSHVKTSYAVFC